MFKVKLKDNTCISVEKEQAELIVENLFEHISGLYLLEAEEVEAHEQLANRLNNVGISLKDCEIMGFKVHIDKGDVLAGNITIEIPYGTILVEYTEFGDHVILENEYFNNNERMLISGGETIHELIDSGEEQIETMENFPEFSDDLALLKATVKKWKAIASTNIDESDYIEDFDLESAQDDSNIVSECTTSGAIASVASPVGTKLVKRSLTKVKRI